MINSEQNEYECIGCKIGNMRLCRSFPAKPIKLQPKLPINDSAIRAAEATVSEVRVERRRKPAKISSYRKGQ